MKKKKTPTKIAKQIFDRKFQKLAGIPGQTGVNAASSAPSMSPPSAPRSLGRALPSPGLPKPLTDGLNTAGKAIWDNGGRQVMQNVVAPAARLGLNSLHGISTAGVGAANAAAGIVGSAGAGVGMLGSSVTDRMGLTKDMTPWLRDNVLRHTGNAIDAGLTDVAGATGDILSGGHYDHDGTFAGPEHSGTAVEQMRSGIRDELGRGSGFDTAFNAANAVGDFAANQAAFGGAGRGINVAARALRGSQLAAPALNAAAQTPVVGAPAAATGRWLAGEAPAANMFQKGLVPYYRASGLQSVADDVYNAGNQIAQVTNPSDRTSDAREYQAQMAAATNEPPLQTQDTPYVDSVTYADPAARADLYDRALNQDTPQPDGTQTAQAQAQQSPQAASNVSAWGAAPQQGPVGQTQAPTNAQPQQSPESVTAWGAAPAQGPTGQPPEQQQAAKDNPAPKFDVAAATTKLEAAKTPEEQKLVIGEMAQGLKANLSGNDLAGAQHVIDGKFDTPEAKAFIDNQLGPAGDRFLKEQLGDNASDPNAFGQAMGMWNSLGTTGQIAFAVGVPLTILGMLGGSGITTLLGALGIGAAGIMGASGGLFGQDAQNSVNGMIGGLGKSLAPMLGINLPNEADIKTRLTAAAKKGPEQAQAELAKVRSEIEPYAKFSPDAQKFLTDSADPNYMYNQAENYANENFEQLANERLANPEGRNWKQYVGGLMGLTGEAANKPGTWSAYFMGAPGTNDREQTVEEALAQQGWKRAALQTMYKAARCWAGYEPVPGKKPYSNDSCRPIGSKKKKTEKKTEKKAARPAVQYRQTPLSVDEAIKIQKLFAERGGNLPHASAMAKATTPEAVRKALEQHGRFMFGKPHDAFAHSIADTLKSPNVPFRADEGTLTSGSASPPSPPVAPQPAPTAPQQAVKPATPTMSPSATPVAATAPTAAPTKPAAPKPMPAPPTPQGRPTMTQMPTNQNGAPPQTDPMPPSPGATAYIKSVRGGRR